MARKTFEAKAFRRYNESELNNLTRKELNSLYRQYRYNANRRLKAIGKSEEFRTSLTYRMNAGQYDAAPSALSKAEIVGKLAQASRMLSSVTGSLSGLRESANKTVETLQQAGYGFVDRSNLQEFGKFMEFARAKYGKKYMSSEQTADGFNTAVGKGIDPESLYRAFDFWRNNLSELQAIPAAAYRTEGEIRAALDDMN